MIGPSSANAAFAAPATAGRANGSRGMRAVWIYKLDPRACREVDLKPNAVLRCSLEGARNLHPSPQLRPPQKKRSASERSIARSGFRAARRAIDSMVATTAKLTQLPHVALPFDRGHPVGFIVRSPVDFLRQRRRVEADGGFSSCRDSPLCVWPDCQAEQAIDRRHRNRRIFGFSGDPARFSCFDCALDIGQSRHEACFRP